MSWANDIQFTEFQKAVLNRSVGKDGRNLSDAMIDSMHFETRERAGEEEEVKVNMRFLSK